jgi:hypothetical protein
MQANALGCRMQCLHAEQKLVGHSALHSKLALNSHPNSLKCFKWQSRLQSRPSRLVALIPAASSESQVAPPLAKSTKLKFGDRYVSLISN